MSADLIIFPRDQVVLVGDTGLLIGAVAPALQPGCYLVGVISDTNPFRFVDGSAIIDAESVWSRLAMLNAEWISGSCFLQPWLHVEGGLTPDDLIDRVTAPVLPLWPLPDDSHKADWWKEGGQ